MRLHCWSSLLTNNNMRLDQFTLLINSIMKLDLWTKDMMVGDMKRFVIQILGGLSETIGNATDDQYMAQKMGALAEEFAQRLLEEENKLGMR